MKIILLKNIVGVGKKYETKDVSDGHALNMLIPRGFAVPATPEASKRIQGEFSKIEGEQKIHSDLLLKNLKDLDGVVITMLEKANEKGHLFAGIHKNEIIPEIQKQTRLQVDAEHIVLDKPIKELGDHNIDMKIGDKKASFILRVEKTK